MENNHYTSPDTPAEEPPTEEVDHLDLMIEIQLELEEEFEGD